MRQHYTGHIKKGDVVSVPFPLSNYQDKAETAKKGDTEDIEKEKQAYLVEVKDRPGVVLFRADTDSFTICAITTKPHREHKIPITIQDFESGNLGYGPSFARPNIIGTFSRDVIRDKKGTLKSQKLKEITDKVKELIDQEPEEKPASKACERPKRRIR